MRYLSTLISNKDLYFLPFKFSVINYLHYVPCKLFALIDCSCALRGLGVLPKFIDEVLKQPILIFRAIGKNAMKCLDHARSLDLIQQKFICSVGLNMFPDSRVM
jgi:hypothetical protein